MHPRFSTSFDNVQQFQAALWASEPAFLRDRALVYLVIAGVCLLVALRFLRRVLAPIGLLVHAIAAVAIVTLAVSAALLFLAASALSGH
jgi:hypothetical protein